jgi:hypothetical protein
MNELKNIIELDMKQKIIDARMCKYSVFILHQDGSSFHIKNVLFNRKQFEQFDILLVWSEHCGNLYFFEDDLQLVQVKSNRSKKWKTILEC